MTGLSIHIRTVAFVAGMALLVGCNRVEPERQTLAQKLAASLGRARLETPADVQAVVTNAVESPRAIMFVHVDWAPMEPQRTKFAEFIVEYQRTYPDHPVMFHYVDCSSVSSGYKPLRALPGWQESEYASGNTLINGWGELVWMERGRVLHVEGIMNFTTAAELVEKTHGLMLAADRS